MNAFHSNDSSHPMPKLPIATTLLSAWGSVGRNAGTAVRLYAPWLGLTVLIVLAWIAGVIANSGFSQPSSSVIGGAGLVPGVLLFIGIFVAIPAIFVAWQRSVHTGERPAQSVQIDSAVWAYIGYSLLIAIALMLVVGLFALLATVVAGITTGLGEGPMSIERLVALAPFMPLTIIPYYLLLSRFSLVLPAIAAGQPMSLSESFALTRGNTWRLTIGAGLVYLPLAILSALHSVIAVAFPDANILLAVSALLVSLVGIYCLHAALSFATYSLKRLAPEPMDVMDHA